MKKITELLADNKTGPLIVIGLFGLLLILILTIFTVSSSKNTPQNEHNTTSNKTTKDSYGHDRFDAIVVAEKIVKDNLKSPSTAKFCGNSDYTVTCSGNTWTVKGYVDAQNSFGATLRNNFTVKFTFISSDRYTIDSCNIS